MPFCAAAAVVHGGVGIEHFDHAHLNDDRVRRLMPKVTMRVDPALDGVAAALTQARVTIHLRDGRVVVAVRRRRARLSVTAGAGRRTGREVPVVRAPRAVRRPQPSEPWNGCERSRSLKTFGR